MKAFLLLLLCYLVPAALPAQSKTATQLSGRVTDARTGDALAGAAIVLSNSRSGTATDSGGYYRLTNIPLGHNVLEISFFGYKTIVEHVDLTGNDLRSFALVPSILVNEGITVTAVGGATSIRKAPIPVTRVTKADLLQTPSSNIIDALSRNPGVSQLSTGPAISKPVIRGLGYNRLVVINDGVRQEGQQWGDEHGIEIDENSVSRVEIVKGPASLIYGSDAMAGVINIITTTPAPNNSVRGNVLASYGTNNRQRSLYASLGANRNGWNWNLWGDLKAAGDYRNKYDDYVTNSKFNERNAGGYVGYNGRWGYSHLIVSSFNQKLGVIEGERDSAGRLVVATAAGDTRVPTLDEHHSADPFTPYQDVQHLKVISDNSFRLPKGRLSLNLAWQSNQRREFGDPASPDRESLHFDLKTISYNTAYHFDDKQNGWNTAIGASGMQQRNRNLGEEVLIPEYDLFDIGGYVYTQKTAGRATFSGGVRFDNRSLTGKGYTENGNVRFTDFNRNFSNLSASVGVSWEASERVLWKLNIARAFRAPSIPELASNGTHEGTNRYEFGRPDLRSETSWQADLGIELNSDHVLFTGNLFYNAIQDFIFYNRLRNTAGSDSLVDVGGDLIPAFQFTQHTAVLMGAEALIDIHPHPLDWLHWENRIAYVRGEFSSPVGGTTAVPFIPAARWVSELRGEFFKGGKTVRNLGAHLELDRSFAQRRAFYAFNTETPTPGYTLLNAGISADIAHKGKTLFSVYLLGSNLTDVAYQSHLSRLKYTDLNLQTARRGVFNMGRNFVFRVNIPLAW